MDDPISEKSYTDENAVNCWHFSHTKHRHVKGINLLSCLVHYGDIALPIGFEVVKKEITYLILQLVGKNENPKSAKMKCFVL